MASRTTYLLELMLGAETTSDWRRSINRASNDIRGISDTATRVAGMITAAFAAVNITQGISEAVESYSDFEQAMANTAGIANASVADYEELEAAARAAGRGTSFTATEAAEALGYMALAGWDTKTSTEALMPVLKLASATGADLQTTSDLVTDSMGALGLEIGDLESYLDMLVAANNNANTSAGELMESLLGSGGAARNIGADLEDLFTGIGILANNGTKASEAGTTMNAILNRLGGNDAARKELDRIGASIFDDTGKFIGLKEALEQIGEATADMTDEERTLSLKKIAGVNYSSEFTYLLNGVAKESEDAASAWEELEEHITESSGAMDTMYDKTTDTLSMAQARFSSAVSDLQIGLVDVFADDAKDIINQVSEQIPNVTESLVGFAEDHRGEIEDTLESVGELLMDVGGVALDVGGWLLDNGPIVLGVVKGITGAFLSAKAVQGALSFAKALTMITPTGAAVMGIEAAIAALIGITSALDEAERAAASQNLSEHFGDIALSANEIDAAARELVGGDLITFAEELASASAASESSFSGLEETLERIKKEKWKLHLGLDSFDSKGYASQLESYTKEAQEYISNKGYEVHIAASLLFGADSEVDLENSAYYASLEEQIVKLNKDLSKIVEKAMEDDVILPDEDQLIQEALEKINHITQVVNDAQSQAELDAITLEYSLSEMDADSFERLTKQIGEYQELASEKAMEAYKSLNTSNRARLELDESYSMEDFLKDDAEAQEALYEKRVQAITESTAKLQEVIEQQYPALKGTAESTMTELWKIFEQYEAGDTNSASDSMFALKLQKYLGEALGDENSGLKEYIEYLKPQIESLDSLVAEMDEKGVAVADSTRDMLSQLKTLELISDEDLDFGDLGATILDGLKGISNTLFGTEFEQARTDTIERIKDVVYDTYKATEDSVEDTFNDTIDGTADISIDANVDTSKAFFQIDEAYRQVEERAKKNLAAGLSSALNTRTTWDNYSAEGAAGNSSGSSGKSWSGVGIMQNAAGGIYNREILTTVAEEGTESIIPWDGSERARQLWTETGIALGLLDRDDQEITGSSQNIAGYDRDIVGYDQVAAGTNRGITGYDRDIAGYDRVAAGGIAGVVWGDTGSGREEQEDSSLSSASLLLAQRGEEETVRRMSTERSVAPLSALHLEPNLTYQSENIILQTPVGGRKSEDASLDTVDQMLLAERSSPYGDRLRSEHDGSGRIERTARELEGGSGGNSYQISFSPSVTITGNASAQDVQKALGLTLRDLKRMLRELEIERRRTSFGG